MIRWPAAWMLAASACRVGNAPTLPDVWQPVMTTVLLADHVPMATPQRVQARFLGREPDIANLEFFMKAQGCTSVPFTSALGQRTPAAGAAHTVRAWSASCLDGHGDDDRVAAEVFFDAKGTLLELSILPAP